MKRRIGFLQRRTSRQLFCPLIRDPEASYEVPTKVLASSQESVQ
jgi:hypothetical protein